MVADEDLPDAVPAWTITFGDMMSLLLTFFIMLVSFSEIKEEDKYQGMVEALQQQFGYDLSQMQLIPGNVQPRNITVAKLAATARHLKYEIVKAHHQPQRSAGQPAVRIMRPDKRTAIGTVVFFAEDAVQLTDEQKNDLRSQAADLISRRQNVEIRGHSSPRPAEHFTSYGDNWELAYARCRAVMAYLVEEVGLDSRCVRISIAGSNEPLPLGADGPQGQRHPRVEVFLIDELEQSGEQQQGGAGESEQRFPAEA